MSRSHDPSPEDSADAEQQRLNTGTRRDAGPWKQWGPYLSERAWGTVREDYSEHGTPWEHFPHDEARSRAYRWNEDGLAGVCDIEQRLCFGLALWNHRDPILKERIFGLTGTEGNHGEDAKEQWWYVDSTPTHSWMQWHYWYPQQPYPYAALVNENRRRGRDEPEFELSDTGVFDEDRLWAITVSYAKASPDDLCVLIEVHNAGPDEAEIDVIPTVWFRNTWSWGRDDRVPALRARAGGIDADHWDLGAYRLDVADGPTAAPDLLFCDNETNHRRLSGLTTGGAWPKDGINDHIVDGADTFNPDQTGTKAAARYSLVVAPGATVQLRLRLRACSSAGSGDAEPFGDEFDAVVAVRLREADEFYRQVIGGAVSPEEAVLVRRAFAGMLWSKQLYIFDVEQWLDGDPAGPAPPDARRSGRNARWRHLNNFDIVSMPDKWEYPWYAAWDLAFHCVTLARVDPDFAKHQLTLLCREWYMHPNGQLPAYEWSFDDVNPPVHAWAALRVFEIDGCRDFAFLEALFHKLLLNFTWWVNREDGEGKNVFEGGFLGLDNIGPFDRSNGLPEGGYLEQSDATAWMATYCLNLLEIALVLADHDDAYEDVATKFFEHFAYIATAMNHQGLWDEELGFYRDLFRRGGEAVPIRAVSMVGLIPLFAVAVLDQATLDRHPDFAARVRWFAEHKPEFAAAVDALAAPTTSSARLLSIVDPVRLRRILQSVLDEERLLSPFGLRSLSQHHRAEPVLVEIAGEVHRLDYEPAESRSGQFGGNSNWRGPVWFPLNFLAIESLRRYARVLGDGFRVECPVGSGNQVSLDAIADLLTRRLVDLLLPGVDGGDPTVRPGPHGADHADRRLVLFHEYFDGDTGKGLGASHQTGWTGLVANLILGPVLPVARRL